MLQIAVAPCSPFSVTEALLRESAALARENGVRMHTHLAETLDEERFCHEHFGCTPVEYMERVGWVGPDVWYATQSISTTPVSRRWREPELRRRTARPPTRAWEPVSPVPPIW